MIEIRSYEDAKKLVGMDTIQLDDRYENVYAHNTYVCIREYIRRTGQSVYIVKYRTHRCEPTNTLPWAIIYPDDTVRLIANTPKMYQVESWSGFWYWLLGMLFPQTKNISSRGYYFRGARYDLRSGKCLNMRRGCETQIGTAGWTRWALATYEFEKKLGILWRLGVIKAVYDTTIAPIGLDEYRKQVTWDSLNQIRAVYRAIMHGECSNRIIADIHSLYGATRMHPEMLLHAVKRQLETLKPLLHREMSMEIARGEYELDND